MANIGIQFSFSVSWKLVCHLVADQPFSYISLLPSRRTYHELFQLSSWNLWHGILWPCYHSLYVWSIPLLVLIARVSPSFHQPNPESMFSVHDEARFNIIKYVLCFHIPLHPLSSTFHQWLQLCDSCLISKAEALTNALHQSSQLLEKCSPSVKKDSWTMHWVFQNATLLLVTTLCITITNPITSKIEMTPIEVR